MSITNRVRLSDGQLADASLFDAIMPAVDAALADIFAALWGGTELAPVSAATLSGATDVTTTAAVRSYGFIANAFRVVRVSATKITVTPGFGLQWAASGVPAGERSLRVVRLDADSPEASGTTGITLGSLPTSGQYKRALVCVKWQDVTTDATAQVMDSDGNVASATVPSRTFPEAGSLGGATPTLTVQYGSAAGSAAGAARPSIPSGYVALAELLLDSTGLANAANVDGVTSGITDLRPVLVLGRAAGSVGSRRATCSIDETTAARSFRRVSAKAVGGDIVRGWSPTIPNGSAGVVALDTSRDWRDMMIEVRHHALVADTVVPGGVSDASATWNTGTLATSGLVHVTFYAGTGSADGTTGYLGGPVRAAADHADTQLTFYVDSTTGALMCRGITGDAASRNLYFRAEAFGPMGRHPASGVEA